MADVLHLICIVVVELILVKGCMSTHFPLYLRNRSELIDSLFD